MLLSRFIFHGLQNPLSVTRLQKCHSVFGIKDLIHQEKPDHFAVKQVQSENHKDAIDIIKKYYMTEHVLVKSRKMDLSNDRALDEYLANVLKQGNSLFAKADDGSIAAICVSFASSPVDPRNLRNYAFYRQDPNTKDFLYFTAKLQETPNLWEIYKQQKVFEIKMLTVLPEFRRQGLATMLAEKSKDQALDQGYNVIRMDCMNPYDFKIAERCMLKCIVKFPLHKLRSTTAPYIKRSSDHNRCVRVYVSSALVKIDAVRENEGDLESLIE